MNSKRFSATLIIVTILALIGLLGTQFNVKGGASAPDLEGSWEITVLPTGGDPIVDFCTFTKGGGLINIDPDPNLSTGIGTWVRTGGLQFAGTFVHFLSDAGAPLGTLKVRAEVTLNPHTDTFTGPFQTDVIIGGDVVQSICGTVQARRLSVEALECP
ncbi:MAG TPA: hypothetical protein VFF31_10380 [Blastocatellia bacterium]|nr:hypothetical protein [Blastocatellia bacterium]